MSDSDEFQEFHSATHDVFQLGQVPSVHGEVLTPPPPSGPSGPSGPSPPHSLHLSQVFIHSEYVGFPNHQEPMSQQICLSQ